MTLPSWPWSTFEFRFLPGRAYAEDLLRQNYVGEIRMAALHHTVRMAIEARRCRVELVVRRIERRRRTRRIGIACGGQPLADLGTPRRIFCDLATFVPERSGKRLPATTATRFSSSSNPARGRCSDVERRGYQRLAFRNLRQRWRTLHSQPHGYGTARRQTRRPRDRHDSHSGEISAGSRGGNRLRAHSVCL